MKDDLPQEILAELHKIKHKKYLVYIFKAGMVRVLEAGFTPDEGVKLIRLFQNASFSQDIAHSVAVETGRATYTGQREFGLLRLFMERATTSDLSIRFESIFTATQLIGLNLMQKIIIELASKLRD
jgi:hypothetical protein